MDDMVAAYQRAMTEHPGVAFFLGVIAAGGPELGRRLAEECDRLMEDDSKRELLN